MMVCDFVVWGDVGFENLMTVGFEVEIGCQVKRRSLQQLSYLRHQKRLLAEFLKYLIFDDPLAFAIFQLLLVSLSISWILFLISALLHLMVGVVSQDMVAWK